MNKNLKHQALLAFRAIETQNKRVSTKTCFEKLNGLKDAINELGLLTDVKLEIKPADLQSLIKHGQRLNPNTLHYHVVSKIGKESMVLAGIYAIPETGVLKFYTDHNNPVTSAERVIGNENALFKILIGHMHDCYPPNLWKEKSSPAIRKLLSNSTQPK